MNLQDYGEWYFVYHPNYLKWINKCFFTELPSGITDLEHFSFGKHIATWNKKKHIWRKDNHKIPRMIYVPYVPLQMSVL